MRDDRALLVGGEPALAGEPRAFVPDERRIDARPVRIAPQEIARAIIFRDEIVAVIKKLRGRAAGHDRLETPERVRSGAEGSI